MRSIPIQARVYMALMVFLGLSSLAGGLWLWQCQNLSYFFVYLALPEPQPTGQTRESQEHDQGNIDPSWNRYVSHWTAPVWAYESTLTTIATTIGGLLHLLYKGIPPSGSSSTLFLLHSPGVSGPSS